MKNFWKAKRVLVTGHTGFKGSWLALWLAGMQAEVFGFALAPDTDPALFEQLSLADQLDHQIGDIRDLALLRDHVQRVQPDVIFHLAAKPLVLESYADPITTWQTNVMGSTHVMEAARILQKPCALVMVTTDKVYENKEWVYPYREVDTLGGHDPYSSSKAAMELAINSWRKSFFRDGSPVRMASARAGNVIGGGDWSPNRIIPDLVHALQAQEILSVRNPGATRPWQHVIEPLAGYMRLAQRLFESDALTYQDSFNFGPEASDIKPVRTLIDAALTHWPGSWADTSSPTQRHEANALSLSIEKSRSVLNFEPRIGFAKAVEMTMHWYRHVAEQGDARQITTAQIEAYAAS